MKGRNIALLRVQPVDYRSLPLLLEQREEAGWKLEKILWPWIGVFRPAEGEQSRYTADLIPENALRDAQKKKEYVQLCADAGWTFLGSVGRTALFRAQPGKEAAPLQTDPELEKRQVKYSAVQPTIVAAVVVLENIFLQLGFRMTRGAFYWFEVFQDWAALLLTAALALLVLFEVLLVGYALLSARRTAPVSPRKARFWGVGEVLLWLLVAAVLLWGAARGEQRSVTILDQIPCPPVTQAGLEQKTSTGLEVYVENGPGLCQAWAVEGLEEGILYTRRYDARWTWLAEAAFDQLAAQADRDKSRQVACGNGTGTRVDVDLPGTEALLLRYERGSYLIVRQDRTVFAVAGPVDWSERLDQLDAFLGRTSPCIWPSAVVG